jgi:hypothetical protein
LAPATARSNPIALWTDWFRFDAARDAGTGTG